MTKLNRFNEIEDYRFFDSIIDASRWSGVSVNALKNACEKGNPKVTRRKGGTQTFGLDGEIDALNAITSLELKLVKKLTIGQ